VHEFLGSGSSVSGFKGSRVVRWFGVREIEKSKRINHLDGCAIAAEVDLAKPETIDPLFDLAESNLGAVDILVNNASGWLADTFTRDAHDMLGHSCARVSPETFDRQFSVDARGSALLIAEFARRHVQEKRAGDGSSA